MSSFSLSPVLRVQIIVQYVGVYLYVLSGRDFISEF